MARPNVLGKSELMAVPVPLDLKTRFETIAELQGTDASKLVRMLIQDDLDQYPEAHGTTQEEIDANFSAAVQRRIDAVESGAYVNASGRRRLERWAMRLAIPFDTTSEESIDTEKLGVLDRLRVADALKRPGGALPLAGRAAHNRLTREFEDIVEQVPAFMGLLSMLGVKVENQDAQLKSWRQTFDKVINSFVRAAVQVKFEGQLPSATEIMTDVIEAEKIWQKYSGTTDPVKPTLHHKLTMRFNPNQLREFADEYGKNPALSSRDLQFAVAMLEPGAYLDAQLEDRPLIT